MNLLTITIDLDAIAHNTRLLKQKAAGAQLMCVVKADGYNHGAARVAATMAAHGADQFGVATLAEALALREAGITQPILAWIWTPDQDVVAALDAGIELGVPSLAHAAHLVSLRSPARVSVKVDTAMNRSGIDVAEWDTAFRMLIDAPHLTVTGLFSHLACADEPENPLNDRQVSLFRTAIDQARGVGLDVPVNHLVNSPGLLTRPDAYFDMVRPGIALYGYSPIPGLSAAAEGLRPAMTWESRITVVKEIHAGEGVSYGQTWRAPSDGYTAVVACGYADGLPRALQGSLEVSINGRRYPQVGRVCMDQIVLWLGAGGEGLPPVQPGERAVLFGPAETGALTADDFAAALGTINYEVICSPHGRTIRAYLGG